MTGVEILAMEEVAIAFGFCWEAFFIMLIAGGAVAIFISALATHNDGCDIGVPVLTILLGVVLLLSILLGNIGKGEPTEYETHYKVIISDEVSMNDFLSKYEIIDQEDKIYTVRERGVEDGK